MSDIIEVEIFNKLFASIAEEMGIVLSRSSFSPNIKERRDYSCAIFDAAGQLVAQAAHIPVHLGSMPMTLSGVLATTTLKPGDVIMVNDPFQGGSHLPDITLIEGVFANGRLCFYVVNRAHHADIGGRSPGSMGLATDIRDEGVLIPPTPLYRQGRLNAGFLKKFLGQVRTPEERHGDLQAQKASLNRGKTRLLELLTRYGVDSLARRIEDLKDYSERLMRKAISRIPNGNYHFTDYLDNDGFGKRRLPITVELTVDTEKITADFSQSADQVKSPLNTVPSVTLSAAVYVCQCLLGDDYPINHGSYRPIAIKTRPGSILAADFPAPVAAGNVETSQRIVDVLLGALAQAMPELIPAASCGSMNNIAVGGHDSRNNRKFAYYETIGGGMGASPNDHGLDGIHTHMTNTLNTPIEALEHAYPFQIEIYGLRPDSGGRGRFRGGNGIIRSYRFLDRAEVSLLADRQNHGPYGLAGGLTGCRGRCFLQRKGRKGKLRGKNCFAVLPGDLLIIETPGGGGWGPKK